MPETKTTLKGNTPYWKVGDKIAVTNGLKEGSINRAYTSTLTEESVKSDFTGSSIAAGTYCAYYPFQDLGVGGNGGKMKYDLAIEQFPTATSFDGNADALISKGFEITDAATQVVDLEFKRLISVAKIVLKDNSALLAGETLKSFSLTTSDTELVGRAYLQLVEQQFEPQEGSDSPFYYGGTKTVKASYTPETTFSIDGTNAVYLCILPCELQAGSTITLTGTTDTKTINKVITVPAGGMIFEEGCQTTVNVALKAEDVTATPKGQALPLVDYYNWNTVTTDDTADFSAGASKNYTLADVKDINGIAYMESGSKLYAYKEHKLKYGTSSAPGKFATIDLDLSAAFDIHIGCLKYGSDTGMIQVLVDGAQVKEIALTTTATTTVIECPAASETSKITVQTTAKRAYTTFFAVVPHGQTPAPNPGK